MIFSDDLYRLIFNNKANQFSDEIIIISGFIGPKPVEDLSQTSLKATVVYGMYGASGISEALHKQLQQISQNSSNLEILYSKIPVHSKVYIWRKEGKITYALLGSANFSVNGLKKPYREILGEATDDSYETLSSYTDTILGNSVNSANATNIIQNYGSSPLIGTSTIYFSDSRCIVPLYIFDSSTGEKTMPQKSGINWGHGGAHNREDVAYIPISMENIRKFPKLFPQKKTDAVVVRNSSGESIRQNEPVEILWDDGIKMEAILEGSQGPNGIYPKQISSFPSKSMIGKYIRGRLGVENSSFVKLSDLHSANKDAIRISLIETGLYYMELIKTRD
ncbi:hypothetical protein BW727_101360 [Jeotgalibaca dankookensis]|uniref:NgoFVII family restriction endonuclease n=1 Tax=Jeotgalibaca dankookensis TaxID=708126 RepID=A0A1S6IQ96_9LACT|nr:restriction endonuclease PLD domain-containing protein [Jeotgalibaca dankookensis]AQS53727.1 hypothetical protein BW727_101360 [Jeotgalibaca dankookensis]